jgi:two-component system OmpR family response regulator
LGVLTSLRARYNQGPLLIITARDGLDDRLLGLDSGADDFMLKRFEMAELLARMRAVLRRKGGSTATREAVVNGSRRPALEASFASRAADARMRPSVKRYLRFLG